MVTNKAWQAWYEDHGRLFGQFTHVNEAQAYRNAAPRSLRDAALNPDAVAVGRYMRRWQEVFSTGGGIGDTQFLDEKPHVPGDTFSDPHTEYSKIVGFLGD